jgi:hypothetical protein
MMRAKADAPRASATGANGRSGIEAIRGAINS